MRCPTCNAGSFLHARRQMPASDQHASAADWEAVPFGVAENHALTVFFPYQAGKHYRKPIHSDRNSSLTQLIWFGDRIRAGTAYRHAVGVVKHKTCAQPWGSEQPASTYLWRQLAGRLSATVGGIYALWLLFGLLRQASLFRTVHIYGELGSLSKEHPVFSPLVVSWICTVHLWKLMSQRWCSVINSNKPIVYTCFFSVYSDLTQDVTC